MANDYDKLKKQLIEYYQDLLIVQYHDKPKAKAMIKAEMEETLANLLDIQVRDAFDVDTAVGVQLDIIGKWVGVDRIFKGQMFDNESWFSLTRYNEPTTPLQGGFSRFDNFDTLEGGFLTYDFIVSTRNKINDTDFRMLIKLKIIRNNIKHSPKDIDEAMYKLFADTLYTVWNEMVYNSDAFTVVGSPTITDDGVASGFSNRNYLTIPNYLKGKRNYEIDIEFTLPETLREYSYIFSEAIGTTGLSLYYDRANVFIRCVSAGINQFTKSIAKGNYKLKIKYNEGVGTVQYRVNNAEEQTYQLNVSNYVDFQEDILYLSCRNSNGSINGEFIGGSINLKQFSITVDGKEVFSGSKSQPMEMTFYYKKKNYGIVKLGQEKNCFPIPTGVKANFVEVK